MAIICQQDFPLAYFKQYPSSEYIIPIAHITLAMMTMKLEPFYRKSYLYECVFHLYHSNVSFCICEKRTRWSTSGLFIVSARQLESLKQTIFRFSIQFSVSVFIPFVRIQWDIHTIYTFLKHKHTNTWSFFLFFCFLKKKLHSNERGKIEYNHMKADYNSKSRMDCSILFRPT